MRALGPENARLACRLQTASLAWILGQIGRIVGFGRVGQDVEGWYMVSLDTYGSEKWDGVANSSVLVIGQRDRRETDVRGGWGRRG